MLRKWTTHKGDEWWYSGDAFEADGDYSSAYPAHLDICIKDCKTDLNEKTLYKFLLETKIEFSDSQIWLHLSQSIKSIILSLDLQKKIEWQLIQNPMSQSARITAVNQK